MELTTHHVFHGRRFRKVSEKYGMLLTLCLDCHRRLHGSKEMDRHVQKRCQYAFEAKYSREEFISIFGKSWIMPEDDRRYRRSVLLESAIHEMLEELEE